MALSRPRPRESGLRSERLRTRGGVYHRAVGLRDVLFGKKQLKGPAADRLFALATAQVTLEVELGLKTAGAAGVCFKPLSAGEFVRAENEMQELLEAVAAQSESRIERKEDSFGYQWLVVRDSDLEDLVNGVHVVGSELEARGFGAQLLAAAFRFDGRKRPVYWIYGYKRGKFWPFVPTGEGQQRDNAAELELKAQLEQELPVEPDQSVWFALYGLPL